MIIKYKPVTDEYTTYHPFFPYGDSGSSLHTEIARLPDGTTYVYLPDEYEMMPYQPDVLTIETVTMTPKLKEVLMEHSPHVRLAKKRRDEIGDYDFDQRMREIGLLPPLPKEPQ